MLNRSAPIKVNTTDRGRGDIVCNIHSIEWYFVDGTNKKTAKKWNWEENGIDLEKMAVLLLHSYRNIQMSILLAYYTYIYSNTHSTGRTASSGKNVTCSHTITQTYIRSTSQSRTQSHAKCSASNVPIVHGTWKYVLSPSVRCVAQYTHI